MLYRGAVGPAVMIKVHNSMIEVKDTSIDPM